LLTLLKISKSTVQISGGVVLFLIAIRLIYATEEDKPKWAEHEPFIVPIATPIIAGASSLAVIMIFSQETGAKFVTLCAIFLAWLASSIIYLFARPIYKIVTEKGLLASQRLMGLIVAIIAVQTAIEGLQGWMKT
ncbi:MAG TPA: MarC family protein, partial [Myxococcota bacterium]|nr:MarC family protein [Myxococcota bacterium]